ncbi:hypothetical protein [Brevibacillus laterosporus]|uniref:hypothetical protein n=1 Tax=Brevibacillus laterosporus TaxID=1465 RepID=UPI000B9B015A|nr:hypothetical protein [Brevibacillus laterosporus]
MKLNSNRLLSGLGSVASVLGLAFVTGTPAGIVTGITGILASITPNEKAVLKEMVYDGFWALSYEERWLRKNPEYDRIEIELPFIEYYVNGKYI